MIFTKEQVFAACDKIAPQYNFEASLIKALCLQEGGRKKDARAKEGWLFAPDRARLEQGYYLRYVEAKNEFATTTEVLLAASYGVTQMMGLSLKELAFFEWWFAEQVEAMKIILGNPYSEIAVPKALNWYCEHLNAQIDWGCKWLAKKRIVANGDIRKTLGYWNGDTSGKYAGEVLAKQKGLL